MPGTIRHIYFIPGTAANSKIFDRIKLPEDQFQFHFIEWIIPVSKNESIEAYVKRLCQQISHQKPILIGVSFGGIIAQEISKIIACEKVVIISSIKSNKELSKSLHIIKKTKLYRVAPTRFLFTFEKTLGFLFGKGVTKQIDVYRHYLSQRNSSYLRWSIKQALNWKQTSEIPGIIHLHGDSDFIFPIKYISNCIPIKKGSHAMILTKGKKISSILFEKFQ